MLFSIIIKEVLQTLRQQVNQPRALLEMTHDFRYFITGACFRIPFEDQQNPRMFLVAVSLMITTTFMAS